MMASFILKLSAFECSFVGKWKYFSVSSLQISKVFSLILELKPKSSSNGGKCVCRGGAWVEPRSLVHLQSVGLVTRVEIHDL